MLERGRNREFGELRIRKEQIWPVAVSHLLWTPLTVVDPPLIAACSFLPISANILCNMNYKMFATFQKFISYAKLTSEYDKQKRAVVWLIVLVYIARGHSGQSFCWLPGCKIRTTVVCYCLSTVYFKVSNIGKCFCRGTRQKSHLHNKRREIILNVYSVL